MKKSQKYDALRIIYTKKQKLWHTKSQWDKKSNHDIKCQNYDILNHNYETKCQNYDKIYDTVRIIA